MRWFKHFVDDNLFIEDLQREHGDAGYAFWFKVCELYAAYGDEEGRVTISWSSLQRRLNKKRPAVERLLDFCSVANRLHISKGGREVVISSPIFLEMLDNYTKYQKGKRKDFEEPLKKLKPEEMRGDEKREEENRGEGKKIVQEALPPSFDEVRSYLFSKGVPETSEVSKFIAKWAPLGWKSNDGVTSWQALADRWISRRSDYAPKQSGVPYVQKARSEPPTCKKCGEQHKEWQHCPNIQIASNEVVAEIMREMSKKVSIS